MMNRSLRNHTVICNWTAKAELILQELRSPVIETLRPVVIISEMPHEIPQSSAPHFDQVFVVPGDPMDDKVLRRANIKYADTAIVLADSRRGSYADMKSILIALAIEAIEPKVYTVVELLHSRNRAYFEHTHVDEIVCTDELLEKLLAQSAITHGASSIYKHLLTATADTNELYKIPVPKAFVNRTYRELEERIMNDDSLEVILIGLVTKGFKERGGRKLVNHEGGEIEIEKLTLNPPSLSTGETDGITRDYVFQPTDKIVVVAYDFPSHLKSLDLGSSVQKQKTNKRLVKEANKKD